ncbi:MAG TPA: DUF4372 domain-containing protein [Thermohalobaculum sp.]|nr:DUF4372 domain-containing protein [Thermohalobaculum sp.]
MIQTSAQRHRLAVSTRHGSTHWCPVSLTKRIPWDEFERLVARHGADRRVRRLPSKTHPLALLFGQLSGAESLRAIVAGLDSQAHALCHLGARPVARSTLADANAARPARLFADRFALMVARAGRVARCRMTDALRVLDVTRLPLAGPLALPLDAEIRRRGQRHHPRQGPGRRPGRHLCL